MRCCSGIGIEEAVDTQVYKRGVPPIFQNKDVLKMVRDTSAERKNKAEALQKLREREGKAR